MKRKPLPTLPLLAAAGCLAAALPAAQAASVAETPHEFHVSADLDGDGRLDMVVVDRASGGFRAAYQLAQGVWTWYPARATGIGDISGTATGRWYDTGREAFAVTSPLANRVHVVEAPTPGGVPLLHPVFTAENGPDQLAAPDVGGPGNTAHDDLWTSTVENGAPSPVRIVVTRHDGASFSKQSQMTIARTPRQARTVRIKEEGLRYVVHIGELAGQNGQLTIISLASGSISVVTTATVPLDSSWTSGLLGGGSLHHFLAWQPGGTSFQSLEVTEKTPNVFGLTSTGVFDTGLVLGQIVIVQSQAGPRLLVIGESGEAARVFSFDGANPPALVQELQPPPGGGFTGAIALPGGGFQMLAGPAGTGVSSIVIPHAPDGGAFTAGAPAQMPVLTPAALRANAFAFASEPFVDPAAQLLGRYNAPDWTSDPVLQGGQLSVTRETLGSSTQGLGGPGNVVIGTVPVGTTFALTNQYGAAVSLHSYAAGDGPTGASLGISPVPGIKTRAFLMSFTPQPANAPVYYRLNNGAWVQWDGNDVPVMADTTVRYFARDPNTQQPSAIQVAVYSFEVAPHELDSDDDGVPDFVERALGLNPLGGADNDGDGYSDLNEILVGTKPEDDQDSPSPAERLEENIAFRMRVAPRPLDGTSNSRTSAAAGARLELFGLDGAALGGGAAANLAHPGVIGPGLALDAVVADLRQGFVTVLTEPVYAVASADPDKDRGREIAGLFAIPAGAVPPVNYVPGNGSEAQEAAAWIDAAILARNSVVRPTVSGNWTEIDTLAGLALEWKLEQIFLARGLPGLAPGKLTLFSGRTGDAGRFAPAADDFADLRLQLSEALPGHDISQLFAAIAPAIAGSPALAGLRSAATAIYRVSSANANAADPGTYLPPFDVLRSFVRGAPLPEPYLSEVGLGAPVLAAAQSALSNLLAGLPARPVQSFTVVVEENSFDGPCHALTLLGTDQPVNLFAAPGQPFASTDGFDLIAGTKLFVTGYTDIVDDACAGSDLEVIDVVVLSFPPVPPNDADGDLLPDPWEETFLLGDGDPYADDDDDGNSNLQELLDGTDPLDPQSKSLEVADLSPPLITVAIDPQGITLTWEFPAAYAGKVNWLVQSSNDFINWDNVPSPVIESPPGLFTVSIPNGTGGIFRVLMSLE